MFIYSFNDHLDWIWIKCFFSCSQRKSSWDFFLFDQWILFQLSFFSLDHNLYFVNKLLLFFLYCCCFVFYSDMNILLQTSMLLFFQNEKEKENLWPNKKIKWNFYKWIILHFTLVDWKFLKSNFKFWNFDWNPCHFNKLVASQIIFFCVCVCAKYSPAKRKIEKKTVIFIIIIIAKKKQTK